MVKARVNGINVLEYCYFVNIFTLVLKLPEKNCNMIKGKLTFSLSISQKNIMCRTSCMSYFEGKIDGMNRNKYKHFGFNKKCLQKHIRRKEVYLLCGHENICSGIIKSFPKKFLLYQNSF